jgi:succinate dehydrogenase / fumarate reductase, flavoprotein subunit
MTNGYDIIDHSFDVIVLGAGLRATLGMVAAGLNTACVTKGLSHPPYVPGGDRRSCVELEHLGVPFSRTDAGKIYQRRFGGHTTEYAKGNMAYRACAAADRTGHAILHTLYQQCLKHKARFFIEYFAIDEDGACRGLLA